LTEHERRQALGEWGEKKALVLLKDAQFKGRDVNVETHNYPFGDIYAERGPARFVVGVKTRNIYQVSGLLNPSYNVRKMGFDIGAIGKRYNAVLAWVVIQVIPELQTFNAYFGTIAQIEERKEALADGRAAIRAWFEFTVKPCAKIQRRRGGRAFLWSYMCRRVQRF
jgi:hypothetical protein